MERDIEVIIEDVNVNNNTIKVSGVHIPVGGKAQAFLKKIKPGPAIVNTKDDMIIYIKNIPSLEGKKAVLMDEPVNKYERNTILIVRQCCIKSAAQAQAGTITNTANVIKMAAEFETWILR